MDSLSFEDHDHLEDAQIVERYLMGQLSAVEREAFEDHYLDCDQCLERLELTRRLYTGLQEISAEEVPRALAQTAQSALLTWLLGQSRAVRSAVALGLLALVVVPWLVLGPQVSRERGERERLAEELSAALAPQPRTPTYRLSPERSGGGDAPSTRVTLGDAPEWVVLSVQLPPDRAAESYRVRLLDAEGDALWTGGPLEPDASGQVTLSVHSSWLEAATYHLELVTPGAGGDGAPEARFSFAVRRGG